MCNRSLIIRIVCSIAYLFSSFSYAIEAQDDRYEFTITSQQLDSSAPILFRLTPLDNDTLETPGQAAVISAGQLSSNGLYISGHFTTSSGDIVPKARITIENQTVLYWPHPQFRGIDSFQYIAEDQTSDTTTSTAIVRVNITAENRIPELVNAGESTILFETYQTDQVLGNLQRYFVDHDGDPIVFSLLASTQHGSLTVTPEGQFIYTPPSSYSGTVSFRVIARDFAAIPEADLPQLTIDIKVVPPPSDSLTEIFRFNGSLANQQFSQYPLDRTIVGTNPNVLIFLDDSVSMLQDFALATDGSIETFRLYQYPGTFNYPQAPTDTFGQRTLIMAYPQHLLDLNVEYYEGNTYGTWRYWHNSFNSLYYNHTITYSPWKGIGSQADYPEYSPSEAPLQVNDLTSQKGQARSNAINLIESDSREYFRTTAAPDYPATSTNAPSTYPPYSIIKFYIPFYYKLNSPIPMGTVPEHHLCANLELDDGVYKNATCERVEIRSSTSTYAGGPNRTDCAVDDNNPLTCTYDQEIQNFTNWFTYHRIRYSAAKAAIASAIIHTKDVNFGYATITGAQDHNNVPITSHNTPDERLEHKASILRKMYSSLGVGSTYIKRSLIRAGEYFSCESGASATLFPTSGSSASCPITLNNTPTCQANHTVIFTDGIQSKYLNFEQYNYTGNYDGDSNSHFDGGRYGDNYSGTVADIAMYFYETDIAPDHADRVPVTPVDRLSASTSRGFNSNGVFMHQHMKTHVFTLSVSSGSVSLTDIPSNPSQTYHWPDPCFTCSDSEREGRNLYSSRSTQNLHTALNGRGRFTSFTNIENIKEQLTQIFTQISSPGTSSNSFDGQGKETRTLTHSYQVSYDLGKKTGDLKAFTLTASDKQRSSEVWSASDRLGTPSSITAANREIFTFIPRYPTISSGNPVITSPEGIPFIFSRLSQHQKASLGNNEDYLDYIRGAPFDTQLRARPSLIGDIITPEPIYVTEPFFNSRDNFPFASSAYSLYSTFRTNNAGRPSMLYIPSNAGMLHAFDPESGDELFAYIPNKLIDNSQRYSSKLVNLVDPNYQHNYFIDSTPAVNDVYGAFNSSNSSTKWATVLIGSLGVGGKGLYALDITSPQNFDEDDILWEFTDADDFSTNRTGHPFHSASPEVGIDNLPAKDLGYVLSPPLISLSNIPIEEATPSKGNKWLVFFGNGYNSTTGLSSLFALDIAGGAKDGWTEENVIKVFADQSPIIDDKARGLGRPLLIDHDRNGTADYGYAGDISGNLYRFDLTNPDPTLWTSTKIFTASYGGVAQPITTQPYVVPHPSTVGYIVIFGTGKLLETRDTNSSDIQSIYGIWDNLTTTSHPLTQIDSPRSLLVEQTITNHQLNTAPLQSSSIATQSARTLSSNHVEYNWLSQVDPTTTINDATFGWHIDFDSVAATLSSTGPQYPGERAIKRFVEIADSLITTTFVPYSSSTCPGNRVIGSVLRFDPIFGSQPTRALQALDQELINLQLPTVVQEDGQSITTTTASFLIYDSDPFSNLSAPAVINDYIFINVGSTLSLVYELPSENTPGRRSSGRLSWREILSDYF